jgi:hypothetical protein
MGSVTTVDHGVSCKSSMPPTTSNKCTAYEKLPVAAVQLQDAILYNVGLLELLRQQAPHISSDDNHARRVHMLDPSTSSHKQAKLA